MPLNILRTSFKLYTKVKLFALLRSGVAGVPYHPVPYAGKKSQRYRGTLERWKATERLLDRRRPSSVLDIGCNSGFFTIELAKRGHFCLGVDSSRRDLLIANALKDLYEVEGVSFAHLVIDPQSVQCLPRFDITLCLSVFHHWALQFGLDGAVEIMRTIAGRTNEIILFETAQTNNCSEKYRRVLPDMGPNPGAWLEDFLIDLGFPEVFSLGKFEVGGGGSGARELMMGRK